VRISSAVPQIPSSVASEIGIILEARCIAENNLEDFAPFSDFQKLPSPQSFQRNNSIMIPSKL
jgi:hypothetical protein